MSVESYWRLRSLLKCGLGVDRAYQDNLESQMIIQRLAFLLSETGVKLPWSFGWNIRGPFSTGLAGDAFHAVRVKEKLPRLEDSDKKICNRLRSLLQPDVEDSYALELLSSLVYVRKNMYGALAFSHLRTRLVKDLAVGRNAFSTDNV